MLYHAAELIRRWFELHIQARRHICCYASHATDFDFCSRRRAEYSRSITTIVKYHGALEASREFPRRLQLRRHITIGTCRVIFITMIFDDS